MEVKQKGGLFYLGTHMAKSRRGDPTFRFDEETWNSIIDKMAENGMNLMFLDIHEGLHYGSHPELAVEDAWTRQKMRRELGRLKEKGITVCPKLNFSACHDVWLGPYEKMLSTPKYYQVCRDLIRELSELFADAPYFHIGMDEEDERHARSDKNFVAAFRQGKQLWYDLQFLLDCVRDCGKTPVIWGCNPMYNYEVFKEHISPEDLVIMHYYYHGVRPEHWTRTDSRDDYNRYYNVPGAFGGMGYAGQGMEYIERDDPFYVYFNKNARQSALDGYDVILCCSNYYQHPHNAEDVVEMITTTWPKERVKGIITCPWKPTLPQYKDHHLEGIRLLGEACDKFGY